MHRNYLLITYYQVKVRKEEEAQGAQHVRLLENERQQLVTLGDEFHKSTSENMITLIATSQAALIKNNKKV